MSIDRRILIADDDREFRRGVEDLLLPLGTEILHAESGEEAVSILSGRRTLHLALLDMHMPGLTGLDVLHWMRDQTLSVPCIFWSGAATTEIERSALDAGARAVLRKPVEPRLLRSEVRRILELDVA